MKPLGLTINAQYTKQVDYIYGYDDVGMVLTNIKTEEVFPIKDQLGAGSFGTVYQTSGKRILKILTKIDPLNWKHVQEEVAIQTKLYEKEPGICPKLYEFGLTENGEGVVVMEKCDGIATKLLRYFAKLPRDQSLLFMMDYLYNMASILQRLEKYEFNHRDMKSDNIMYKLTETGQIQYVLIDFGFSCATFDGVKYQGTAYYPPETPCFRRSRDLTMIVYEFMRHVKDPEFLAFTQLLLTFTYEGKVCDMSQGCEPYFKDWSTIYRFTNNVDNPNLTPEGLMAALDLYQSKGLEACKSGFVVHPVQETCVPVPPTPTSQSMTVPISPKQHMLNPAPDSKGGRSTKKKSRKQKRTVG